MKQTLLFIAFLFSISSVSLGQTNTWIGATDSNWETNSNWSLGYAPNDDVNQNPQDVIIPTGSNVVLNYGSRVNTLVIDGTATFTHLGILRVLTSVTIQTNAIYNWNGGRFTSGGTVTNYGTMNFSTSTWMFVESGITFNNYGNLNLLNGTIYLNDGTINNQSSGTIDLKNDDTSFSNSTGSIHLINNYGLIKKSVGTGNSYLSVEYHNFNNGTITVETGNLELANYDKFIQDGSVFNVNANATLTWHNGTTLCEGTMSGVINGQMILLTGVSVPTAATFNFSGTGFVNWGGGTFNGSGVLTNLSTLAITAAGSHNMNNNLTIDNQGTINFLDAVTLNFNSGIINNLGSGIIDIKADGQIIYANNAQVLNNYGLIKKSSGAGVSTISTITNNAGTIAAIVGTLEFTLLNNLTSGVVKGTATIDLPSDANFTNNGSFAPGMSPGTLTVIGNFNGTDSSSISIELNGSSQGTEYDLLAIQGNAIFNGNVAVSLGFAPAINDAFTIATTTGTITQCNLASTTSATFGGYTYTFSVSCVNNNKVALTTIQKTLGVISNAFNESSIVLYPNPAKDIVKITNTSNEKISSIEIIDSNGRSLKTIPPEKSNQEESVFLENYAAGNYFIKLSTEKKQSIVKKILIQ